ncbi:MAG: caspase family protein [Bacteroidales bacterium]|jgi:hypothetical protein|nr:caspase family protein [Bacteroidales bacterium]MCI1785173.1 caspase family protein [Bacteroidales bacterium]
MKRMIFIFLLSGIFAINSLGENFNVAGVDYTILENGTVACIGTDGSIEVLNIPETVNYGNKSYTVTEINCNTLKDWDSYAKETITTYPGVKILVIPGSVIKIDQMALAHSEKLTKVTIPNSVKDIGVFAFSNCTSLEEIVMPDSTNIEYYKYDSASGPFISCESISKVRGNTIQYPEYVIESGLFSEIDCPFAKQIPAIKSSFSYYAYNRIKSRILEWQKKKEYETTAQWKKRVTEETRKQKVQQIIKETQKEYIAGRTPEKLNGTLGTYDADYSIYPVNSEGYNTFYVKVPISEAPAFKEKWNTVQLIPEYGIINDHFGILSCKFKLMDKQTKKTLVYNSPQKYGEDQSSDLTVNLPPLEIDLAGDANKTTVVDNDVDMNIPAATTVNAKTFAVIIGNENYQRVAKVAFAGNDAETFAAYCKKTLGLPANNVRIYKNATYGTMLSAVKDIQDISEAYNGDINIIFYYAGHGIPTEDTKEAYLLPVDADGSQPEVCYPLTRLYKNLEDSKAKSVIVFLDACFSGAQRGDGMLASARGVTIKVKQDIPQGNMVVFSAARGDETAYPYNEKGHGLFTYFLLKELQQTKGDVTLGELSNYVTTNVSRQSIVINRKSQTPTVVPSVNLENGWQGIALK